jgi:predicted CXXCH cytochrome family protein
MHRDLVNIRLALVFIAAFQLAKAEDGYLDSGACAECHSQIAASYARTGMARSLGLVNAGTAVSAGTFRHDPSEQLFAVSLRGGKPYLKRQQSGADGSSVNILEAEMRYWVGSGLHARTYLSQTPSGKLIELPLTRYAEKGGYWAMSPGFDRPDHSGFSRKLAAACLFCHTGYLDAKSQFKGQPVAGIDCQRCHGPGRDHVGAVRAGQPADRVRSSIVNPARLSTERRMEVCLQCHLETTSHSLPASLLRPGRDRFSYRPGEPLSDYILHFDFADGAAPENQIDFVSAPYRLALSACFRKSRGALTCTTCHNPHDIPRGTEAVRQYDQACRGCHATLTQHPAQAGCAGCHMQKRRPSDVIHVTVADHFIRKRPPLDSPDPNVEWNDGNSPPYRGYVALYYPPTLARTPGNELALAVAQVKQQSNLARGLPELDALIARLRPERAEYYFELAEAWRNSGRPDRAIPLYDEAGRREPKQWRYAYALGVTQLAAEQPELARQSLQRAAALEPEEPDILKSLSYALIQLGAIPEAVAALRKAIGIDPEYGELRNNLGTALLKLNDLDGAEAALREAVRLRPEIAATHVNLASIVSRRGDQAQAKFLLERAIRLNPAAAQPHQSLATMLAWMGDPDGAIREAQIAVRLLPDYYAAHVTLAQSLLARGRRAEAEAHLRKAAESSDSQVRQLALELFKR